MKGFGVNCAVATPVDAAGRFAETLFAAHCTALLEEGCDGLAILGTTGEANNFSAAERRRILEAALAAGIAGDKLLPGTSACSVAETVELTRHAVEAGAKACVLLPPFYYKGVSDEGLHRFYAEVIEGVGDARLRVLLYHIPQVTQVPLGLELIARLVDAFPHTVVGIKDSAGDFANMTAMLPRFPGFSVLAGADTLLLPLLRAGGAGCITATSNLRAADLRAIADGFADPAAAADVDAAQERIEAWRTLSTAYVQIPTIKAMLSQTRGDDRWVMPRPPLLPLDDTQRADLFARMKALPR